MEEYCGQERRRHPRIDSKIVVSYHREKEDDNYDLTQTKNLSQGGMLLVTNRKFEKGAELGMTILFPFLDGKAYVLGEVVDSKEVVKNMLCNTRLKFLALEKGVVRRFENFMKEHLR